MKEADDMMIFFNNHPEDYHIQVEMHNGIITTVEKSIVIKRTIGQSKLLHSHLQALLELHGEI